MLSLLARSSRTPNTLNWSGQSSVCKNDGSNFCRGVRVRKTCWLAFSPSLLALGHRRRPLPWVHLTAHPPLPLLLVFSRREALPPRKV